MKLQIVFGRVIAVNELKPQEKLKPNVVSLTTRQNPDLVKLAVKAVPSSYKRTRTNAIALGLYLLATMPKEKVLEFLKQEGK